jgi:thiamine-phosphate pyrophosphorylase
MQLNACFCVFFRRIVLMDMKAAKFYKLVLVTNACVQSNSLSRAEYLAFIARCAEAGITAVQLREKSLSYTDLVAFGKKVQSVLKPFAVPLIVNDSVQLALDLDADGVHLGQSDGCVLEARRVLGANKIIGQSIESIAQLSVANQMPLDYVGISAIFPTRNKLNIETIWGCDGLKQMASLTNLPIIAIGGINELNVFDVMEAGADGIAAIGAFHDAQDPALTTKNLLHFIEGKNS